MNFLEAKTYLFEKLAPSKIMALASSVNDYVMVRNVSCLIYNDAIYFKTDKNFRKTKQLYKNPRVALCYSGIQVEGKAEILGLVIACIIGAGVELIFSKKLYRKIVPFGPYLVIGFTISLFFGPDLILWYLHLFQ